MWSSDAARTADSSLPPSEVEVETSEDPVPYGEAPPSPSRASVFAALHGLGRSLGGDRAVCRRPGRMDHVLQAEAEDSLRKDAAQSTLPNFSLSQPVPNAAACGGGVALLARPMNEQARGNRTPVTCNEQASHGGDIHVGDDLGTASAVPNSKGGSILFDGRYETWPHVGRHVSAVASLPNLLYAAVRDYSRKRTDIHDDSNSKARVPFRLEKKRKNERSLTCTARLAHVRAHPRAAPTDGTGRTTRTLCPVEPTPTGWPKRRAGWAAPSLVNAQSPSLRLTLPSPSLPPAPTAIPSSRIGNPPCAAAAASPPLPASSPNPTPPPSLVPLARRATQTPHRPHVCTAYRHTHLTTSLSPCAPARGARQQRPGALADEAADGGGGGGMKPRALLERLARPFTRRSSTESRRDREEEADLEAIAAREQRAFRYEALEAATRGFSEKNRLGQGGFGPVYRGRLDDGRDVAVKRLGAGSRQGAREFRNEATLLSRVQHRNVVNLIGYCARGADDKLLVYEYVPNESLDKILFSPASGHCESPRPPIPLRSIACLLPEFYLLPPPREAQSADAILMLRIDEQRRLGIDAAGKSRYTLPVFPAAHAALAALLLYARLERERPILR
ncbi:hypothetical protein HU200_059824 [Digitaria exilis]|uniref:Protein kinase domain-containing protein n=1 Tax=Digitaria exilis TaxID=1010633 RepID=A0A835AKE4_9POAL|nr:hypothetical protein HU200_059824 [Digitaria exilis]